ncbi:MAG: Unknown protein [uncultured Thiotrichaceae bacterium]|uniref:DUF1641 domain-containing protein n=1 Tax=uncultured Thiotrichaceae bacterium TaxID=298394 RepID=A0A6S6SHJ7_9GAMM|nr:MAG: Unknown protein [uncultured Thiotrichaceae bacterium]
MNNLPNRQQQIIQIHASLIHLVVDSIHNPDLSKPLDDVLKLSSDNGWTQLVEAIRKVISGERNIQVFLSLDEEDKAIVQAIIDGIINPATLPPKEEQRGDPTMAAPGLAKMIHDAATGNAQALSILANMSEQMSQAGGDMSRMGGIMKRLVDGERDPDILCRGMAEQGRSLVNSILDELALHTAH